MFQVVGLYLSIFFGLFFTGVGIPPIPEEVMIASAAALTAAHDEQMHWYIAWPATILGIMCADSVLYLIGRRWGRKLFKYRWVQRIVKPDRRERIEKQFGEHGMKILLTARLLPPLRTGVFMVAGAAKYSYLKFLVADGIYGVVGVGIFFFGSQWLIHLLIDVGKHWAIYIGAGALALFALYHYYSHLRKREMRGAAEPPESVLEMPPPPPAPEVPAPAAPATQPATGEQHEGIRSAEQREAIRPS